ncbi:histidine kinase dimerization/phosphoacceptor domain -containing protein [Desulfobulbus alkaliphilus]|uniref:histidine kinase dimerization/phosphoacceptor domain -containing protein n=1 Tax=Desulfobulbus alkaliphilus TaxID=869814 RepID=UPI001963EC85|nr:histidine kinase dimerization/phosphoacceptor domain -containing protein [Desulfobulbus alkaliphilus]MBM9537824.1 PAS domain-containing protein [Desulfobulbus alkaliphilus]
MGKGRLIAVTRRSLVLCIILFFACLPPVAAHDDPATRHVLVIHSYHPDFPWTDSINHGMVDILHGAVPDIDIHIEYLDAKRHQPERILPAFRELLFHKYQATPLDVIIVSDDAAFQSILLLRDSLFPGVPVVFCGVNLFEEAMIDGFAAVTGVVEDFDLAGTLDIALTLQPKTKHLAVVSDSTESGRLNLERFRQIKSHYSGRFASIIELAELSEQELREELTRLDKNKTIILLLSFYRDRHDKAFSVPEMTELIAQSARLPVYSSWDFVLGHKVVGGRVVSGLQQGRTAAELALRVLNGEPAGAIPIVRDSPNLFMFDHRELSFFGIDPARLPKESVVLNQPQSTLREYLWLIVGLALFVIVETVLILALIKKSRHYRMVKEALGKSEERFSLAMQAAKDGIFDWNLETDEVYYSPGWKQMFGYREEEVENRISEWERLTVAEDVKSTWQLVQEHLAGKRERFAAEFKMHHKDGHLIDVLARGRAVIDATGKPVRLVGTHVDITERKRHEQQLATALGEKEVLLREVHHRVKNNLAAIISLMDMQRRTLEEPKGQVILSELSNRIRSMSLVHEKLYRADSLASIDFHDYLQALISHLRTTFGSPGIIVRVDAPGVTIPLDLASPCGLIVNELVTNALKYAFPEGKPRPGKGDCRILVRLHRDKDTYTLTVADNGIGWPAGFDWTKTRTLGMTLVRMLGQHQLGGRFIVDLEEGTSVTLIFTDRKKEKPIHG